MRDGDALVVPRFARSDVRIVLCCAPRAWGEGGWQEPGDEGGLHTFSAIQHSQES